MPFLILIAALFGLNAKPSIDLVWQAVALLLVAIGYVAHAFCELLNEAR